MPRVVAHYSVEIWLWASPEGKEGQLAPTPRRCSAGFLKYRQCVLEECESDSQYRKGVAGGGLWGVWSPPRNESGPPQNEISGYALAIPPHTIIPGAGPVWRCITQLFSIISPWCLQTQMQPSWCYRQKRDSSVKTISFHSAVHILLSSHHWRRRRLWFCVKGRRSNGRLADRPLCCKRRRMVRADTG